MSKNVYVIGVFDLFHRGHIELLKKAKQLGDKLIVAINGDEMVAQYKRQPVFSEEDRLFIIEGCKYVDEAFIINDFDNKKYLLEHQVSIIIHGDDWPRQSYLEQIRVDEEFLERHNISLILLPYTKGISTSDLIRNIKNGF